MNDSLTRMAIQTSRLGKRFGTRTVLNRLDLKIAAGESVAVIGPNGCGKTTLLRCLAGTLCPSAGDVKWFDQPAALTPASRCLVGMVAHEGLLYAQLTVRENLLFAARMYGVPRPDQRIQALIRTADLEPHALYPAGKLSRGLRQRLAIARALVHDPPILLLDEPFAALDAAGTKWLQELLRALQGRKRAICFTTHDVTLARACADRILMLCCGALQEFDAGRTGNGLYPLFARAA